MPLYGAPAIGMGVGCTGAALALTAAYLFGRLERYWRFAGIGVVAGIICGVLGWGYTLWWALVRVMS